MESLASKLMLLPAKQAIDSLNLDEVIKRLVYVDGWSEKNAVTACQQYKKFLFLKWKYGSDFELPPSEDIDHVWHAHILHTENYAKFCNNIFGFFLHHHPHLLKEDMSQKQLNEKFEQTQILYYQEFGEYIYCIKNTSLASRWLNKLKALLGCKFGVKMWAI